MNHELSTVRISTFFAFMFILLVSGCATGTKFKSVAIVPDGKALLYIYREDLTAIGQVWEIFVNKEQVAKLTNGTYYVQTLEPGPVVVASRLGFHPLGFGVINTVMDRAFSPDGKILTFYAIPNSVYYVFCIPGPTPAPVLVNSRTAILALRNCRAVEGSKDPSQNLNTASANSSGEIKKIQETSEQTSNKSIDAPDIPAANNSNIITVPILDRSFHMGDNNISQYENPKPDGSEFRSTFIIETDDLTETQMFILTSDMVPNNHKEFLKGHYKTKLYINNAEVAILNSSIEGTEDKLTIHDITIRIPPTLLKTGENEIKIVAGYRSDKSNYDDFQLHRIELKYKSPQVVQQEFSSEFPKMQIGDEWRIDTLRGVVVRKVIKVETNGAFILEEKSETNSDIFHLYYDDSYRLTARVNKETGIYSKITKPPHNYLDFPLSVGKAWKDEVYSQSTDGNFYNYKNSYNVEKIDMKKIECGTFKTFKIIIDSLNVDKNRRFKESLWYSPELKIIIKSEAGWKKDTEVLAFKNGSSDTSLPSTAHTQAVANETSTNETSVKNEKVVIGNNTETNQNNLQSSTPAIEAVINRKPSNNIPQSQETIELGVQMTLTGDFINALDFYNKSLSADQGSAKAWIYKGLALLRLRRYQESIDSFDKALSIDNMNLLAYSGKIRALYALSREGEAIQLIDKATNIKPKDAMGYLGLGAVYYARKNYNLAIKQYEEAIRLQPNYVEAFLNLGDAYDEFNDKEKAIQNYQKAISLSPNCALAYLNMGQTYAKRDAIDKASEMFTHAIKINPNYSVAYFNRGLLYRKQKQHEKAMQDYDKAIELDPGFPNTYNERGLINGQRGNYRAARQDWQKTIDLDPSGPVGERARKNLSILKDMGY